MMLQNGSRYVQCGEIICFTSSVEHSIDVHSPCTTLQARDKVRPYFNTDAELDIIDRLSWLECMMVLGRLREEGHDC